MLTSPAGIVTGAATAHVGGQTATFADLGDRVQERMPRFVVAVLLLSFVLLTVLFRSVLVPLKAVVLNLLSVGAAYGVLVMVFQWGWAAGLIGVESTVPIVSFIPLFMFAILFGLSMDYEVFLLSRVREEYRRHGDNTRAVIAGIAGTGRTITLTSFCLCRCTVVFREPPSGSPQTTRSSVPISTSGSTVASESARASFALYPVKSESPTTASSWSSTESKFEEP